MYYIKSMIHVLFFGKYDIIHLHHAESGFIMPFLRLRYKVVVTFHGVYHYIDPKFSRLVNSFFRFSQRLNLKFASEVTSVSQPDIEFCRSLSRRNIHYIPNGINLVNVRCPAHAEPYILFAAGRIYEIKGLELLLEAYRRLGLTIKLKIAGKISNGPGYEAGLTELSKGLNVEFLGLIKDKNKLFRLISGAQLFIFPSLTEAMSMMLLEVISVRTPVIASDIAANKAVFSENEMLFFKSGNIDDLADKLQWALEHPVQMDDLVEKAFQKLLANYTWDKVTKKYDEIFSQLIFKIQGFFILFCTLDSVCFA